jgi:hypothetical protein
LYEAILKYAKQVGATRMDAQHRIFTAVLDVFCAVFDPFPAIVPKGTIAANEVPIAARVFRPTRELYGKGCYQGSICL